MNTQPHVIMDIALLEKDGDNAHTKISFDTPYFPELGESSIQCIFECFQKFLYAAGFDSYGGLDTCLFDQPLTTQEYDQLSDYLDKIRKEQPQ